MDASTSINVEMPQPDRIAPGDYQAPQSILEVPPIFAWSKADQSAAAARQSLNAEAFKDSVAFVKSFEGRNPNGTENTTGGTGFFVTKDGALVTDYHVVRAARGILVTTSDGVVHRASIKDVDPATDLALLQVEPAVGGESFRPAKLAQSSKLGVLEDVFTRGHPRSSHESIVSRGTNNSVSSLDRFNLEKNGGLMPGEDPRRAVITTAMSIETGNSGGPLHRDSDGAVVGVIGFRGVDTTMAVSTPVEDLHRLLRKNNITPTTADTLPLSLRIAGSEFGPRARFDLSRLPRTDRVAAPAQPQPQPQQPSLIDRFANMKTLPARSTRPGW